MVFWISKERKRIDIKALNDLLAIGSREGTSLREEMSKPSSRRIEAIMADTQMDLRCRLYSSQITLEALKESFLRSHFDSEKSLLPVWNEYALFKEILFNLLEQQRIIKSRLYDIKRRR